MKEMKENSKKNHAVFLPLVPGKKDFPEKRTPLFRVVKQRAVVIPYRSFGTTYWSHPQGSRIRAFGCLNPEDGSDMLSRNVGKELPLLAA